MVDVLLGPAVVIPMWYLIGLIGCVFVLVFDSDFQIIRLSDLVVSLLAAWLGPITIIAFLLFSIKWKNVIIYRKSSRYSDY